MIRNSKRDTQRAGAMRRSVNMSAIKEKVVPPSGETLPQPTSFRLPPELKEALNNYVYSEKNTEHLTKTQIVIEAISQRIGYTPDGIAPHGNAQ